MSNEHNTTQFDFEVFRSTPRPPKHGLLVSIYHQRRELRMNRLAFEAIGSPQSVILLYDASRRVMAIRPTYTDDPEAVRLRRMTTGQAQILVFEFLRTYNIPLPSSIRFLDPHVQNETLILDLNRTVPVKGPRKNARPQRQSPLVEKPAREALESHV
jgi:hypothetical protein